MIEDKVACRTPTEGRDGVTRINRWKFETVRNAILDAVKRAGPDGMPFAHLANEVRARLSDEELTRLGSVPWHVTSVKLELEVRGEISRKHRVIPQQLIAT